MGDHKKLSFPKAVNLTQSAEAAKAKSREFKGSSSPAVHKVAPEP